MTTFDSQKRICKEICKRYQVKKPTEGRGRYESGQAHCQICDIWVDHNGCFLKDGSSATEGSVGWTCKCCNYRVRQKPRNLVYKEKLRNKTLRSESDLPDTANTIAKKTEKLEQKIKKLRMELEQKTSSKEKKEDPLKKTYEKELNELLSYGEIPKSQIKKIKKLSTNFENFDDLFFRENNEVANIEILYDYFRIALAHNLDKCPTLSEYYDYGGKYGIDRFKFIGNTPIQELFDKSLTQDVFDIYRYYNKIKSQKIIFPDDKKILEECNLLISNYKQRGEYDDETIERIDDLIEVYNKYKSLKIISDLTAQPEEILRKKFRTLHRVPTILQKFVQEDKLTFDPILSKEIAIHATDFLNWDGEKENEENVTIMAKLMAKCFSKPENLEMKKEFFLEKDDYEKPIKSLSKSGKIKQICEEWPVRESKFPFNRFTDRSGKQYKMIVYYMKNPDAARFLRRWEYEKGKRISKKWASHLISNPQEFVLEHKNEFND